MNDEQFLALMNVPEEWLQFDMVPTDFLHGQMEVYEEGDEESSEHYRNGLFWWWIKQNPSKDIIVKLIKLTYVDGDQLMARGIRKELTRLESFDDECQSLIEEMAGG